MFSVAILSAIGGFLSKACDDYVDKGLNYPVLLFFTAAICYGAVLGWLSVSTPLSALFIALAVSTILAGKIDHPIHILAIAAFALILCIRPMIEFDAWFFAIFLASGLFDELNLRFGRIFLLISKQRLFTPLAALAIMLHSGQYIFLMAIIAFDVAYRFAGWLIDKRMKRQEDRARNSQDKKTTGKKNKAKRRK